MIFDLLNLLCAVDGIVKVLWHGSRSIDTDIAPAGRRMIARVSFPSMIQRYLPINLSPSLC